MLKANVGLSRKLSENYNSTGFSLNLEGEINATLDDPEAVIETDPGTLRPRRGGPATAGRGPPVRLRHRRPGRRPPARPTTATPTAVPPPRPTASPSRNGHRDAKPQNGEPATNKQVQFLQTLAKRQKLFGPKLEAFIEEAIGRRCSPYDLTKKEAGAVIDALNPEEAGNNRSRR